MPSFEEFKVKLDQVALSVNPENQKTLEVLISALTYPECLPESNTVVETHIAKLSDEDLKKTLVATTRLKLSNYYKTLLSPRRR